MPDPASLCMVDDAYVTITDITAAQNLPAGWYTVSGASSSATTLYLNVTVTETSSGGTTTISKSAAISTTAGSGSTGDTVYPILIAQMATDATSGAKTVKQFLSSAVTIAYAPEGAEGGGGGLSGYVDFVGDVKYDLSYHQIQQRIDTLNLATGAVTQGQYTMITNGQAVPLSGG